jgi:hypothetical protein
MKVELSSSGRLPGSRKSWDEITLVSNIALIGITAIFLIISVHVYRTRIETVSLNESRFLTTEWRLLRELRAQTDRQLLEKEQEIADLSERYLKLIRANAAAAEVNRIETRLEQARNEREQILARTENPPTGAEPDRSGWINEILPTESNERLTGLLRSRIEQLEREREEGIRTIDALKAELDAFRSRSGESDRRASEIEAENRAMIERLADEVRRLEISIAAARETLERKARDDGGTTGPGIEELSVFALVRAIAGSPAVRTEYPDLVPAFDRYLDSYVQRERAAGRREAYADAAETLGRLRNEAAGR